MSKHALLLAACIAASGVLAQDTTWQHAIRTASAPATVFITVDGLLENGLPHHDTGTGFLITTDGYVLTCNHLLPPGAYKQLKITGAVGDRNSFPYLLTVVKPEASVDLALLKFTSDKKWPALQVCSFPAVRPDDAVFSLGFPFEENVTGVTGAITNTTGLHGHWRTRMPLNHGMSGAPVFNVRGDVIGVAAGGMENAQLLNDVIPLQFGFLLIGIANVSCTPTYAARAANLRVIPEPDTVAIAPGQPRTVVYRFSELAGSDVQIESRDIQFLTSTGTPLGPPCNACPLPDGKIRVNAGGIYKLTENVLLPTDIATEAIRLGADAVNLQTTFNGRDDTTSVVRVTSILRIVPLVVPPSLTKVDVNFSTTDDKKEKDTVVRIGLTCVNRVLATAESTWGEFTRNSESGWIPLSVTTLVDRSAFQSCAMRLDEMPARPEGDEWHFAWSLRLTFSDGSSQVMQWGGGSLNNDRLTIIQPFYIR